MTTLRPSSEFELSAIVPAPGVLPVDKIPITTSDTKDDVLQSEEGVGRRVANVMSIPEISNRRAAAIIGTVAGVTFLNTMGSGILTVALPRIAKDMHLSRELLLWSV